MIGFIPFPRVLVLCEMHSVSSRIWTRVAVSNSYDYNHYTTGTSTLYLYRHYFLWRLHTVTHNYFNQNISNPIFFQLHHSLEPATVSPLHRHKFGYKAQNGTGKGFQRVNSCHVDLHPMLPGYSFAQSHPGCYLTSNRYNYSIDSFSILV